MTPSHDGTPRLDALLPLLQCPVSGQVLRLDAERLVSADGAHSYLIRDGVPDLRKTPERVQLDLPWYEPWEDLDQVLLAKPTPAPARDLPYHLDQEMAGVFGSQGNSRLVLEVGCGERQCEPFFQTRGFHYIGVDIEARGQGPHVLADAHNLPFRDGVVDYYTSMAVFEHISVPLVATQEAFRLLKPGGVFCGTADFVYGFHDHASFFHMTHGGLLCVMRTVGFEVERIWPDWRYMDSIATMGFGGRGGWPWRMVAKGALHGLEKSFRLASWVARKLTGKKPLDTVAREVHKAGSLSWVARKPL